MRKIDEAYDFIKKYIAENDYPPTIREIADAINIKSTSTVAYYLRKLEEENKIVKGSYKNRSIQLMEYVARPNNPSIISLPYIYNISTGQPITVEQNIIERYSFSGTLFKGLNMFLMPVRDNSMKDSGILKDDIVVVSRQNVTQNGEIIVAIVGNSFVVARMTKEFRLFKLEFDAKGCSPIYAEKLAILGKVVGVIRNKVN